MAQQRTPAEPLSIPLPDDAATAALGQRLAALLRRGDIAALSGELGSGKTALARAVINALPRPGGERRPEDVPSPTFTLVQIYERTPAPVWHFDLYRLNDPEEVVELGWDEAVADGIVLVEWPDRLAPGMARGRLDITLRFADEDKGRVALLQGDPEWKERLEALAADV